MAETKQKRQDGLATSAQIESDDISSPKKLINFTSAGVGQKSPTGTGITEEFSSGEAEPTTAQLSDKDRSEIRKNRAAEWFFKILTWLIPSVLIVIAIAVFGYLLDFSGRISRVEENVRNLEKNQTKTEQDNNLKFDKSLQDILNRINRLEERMLK